MFKWGGTTEDVTSKCIQMDAYVYYLKKNCSTFEQFINKVQINFKVTNIPLFRKLYWDVDFKDDLLCKAYTFIKNKNELNKVVEVINSN